MNSADLITHVVIASPLPKEGYIKAREIRSSEKELAHSYYLDDLKLPMDKTSADTFIGATKLKEPVKLIPKAQVWISADRRIFYVIEGEEIEQSKCIGKI